MERVRTARIRVDGLQPVQVLAAVVGLALLVAGLYGYASTGFGHFAGHTGVTVLGFATNPLNDTLYIVLGLLGLLMATGSGLARMFGWLMLVVYGLAFVWGMMLTGLLSSNPVSRLGNPLDLNRADTWLYLGLTALGLIVALLPARKHVLVEEPAAATAQGTPTQRAVEPRTEPVTEPIPQRPPQGGGKRTGTRPGTSKA